MKKTDLEVMHQMCVENKDIRCSCTLTDLQMVKAGGKITFGVDRDTFYKLQESVLCTGEYYAVVYVINRKQFDEIKG